jgi:hypothetical protein
MRATEALGMIGTECTPITTLTELDEHQMHRQNMNRAFSFSMRVI